MYIFCDSQKSNLGRETREGNGKVDWQQIGNVQDFRQTAVCVFRWWTVLYLVVYTHILRFGSIVLPHVLYSQ